MAAQSVNSTYFSQTVSVIEGIGEYYSEELNSLGIISLQDLLSINPAIVHKKNTHIPLALLEKFKMMTWLLMVDGINPDIAQCLVDEGIESINELADKSLRTLCKVMTQGEIKNKMNDIPDHFSLSTIQHNAEKLRSTGIAIGSCLSKLDQQSIIADGSILVTKDGKFVTRAAIDDEGHFFIKGLKNGLYILHPEFDDYFSHSFPVYLRSGRVSGPHLLFLDQQIEENEYPELREIDGAQIQITSHSKVRLRKIELSQLPNNTYLNVQKIYNNGDVKLVHHFRTRQGAIVYIDIVTLDNTELPNNTQRNTLLHYNNGQITLSEQSLRNVMIEHFRSTFAPVKLVYKKTFSPANRIGKSL
ncbi:DUF4332 domain-containing protein [bacterium AH-315-K03]|nr:DUF4332 domain-containing protein [bacterium AH-315-K03]